MTQISALSVRSYLFECISLLYWAYFKPYTFARWLHDIHPGLKPPDNPFKFRDYFQTNPQLRRYAWQVWILTAVIPIPMISLAYYKVQPFSSNFSQVSLLLAGFGWLIGLYLAFNNNQKILRWFQQLIWFLVAIPFGSHNSPFWGKSINWLVQLWFVACGLALALNVQWGMWQGFGLAVSWVLALFIASRMNISMVWVLFCLVAAIAQWQVAFFVVFIAIPLALSLLELSWMISIYLLSRRGSKVRWLVWLPPRFNERILIPLPFMAKIIVEAHDENPTAARQTINYLLNYTNQEKIAAWAMSNIAIQNLQRCETLEDIVQITSKLSWIPSPLPKELGSALPQFLDVSQDVQAAMNATSVYLKYQLLSEPISDLQELLQYLAVSKDAQLAKTFGSIAQQWLMMLEQEKSDHKQESLRKAEIRQVYIAGPALDPQTAKERFKGRDKIFREIEKVALADQAPVLLLYGRRRTGKTSALKYLPNRVAASLVPLFVDMQGTAIATTLPGLAEQMAKQIFEAAKRLPRRLDFPDPSNIFRIANDPFVALDNWFGEIERTFPDKRFLLCLDEFSRLDEFVKTTGSRAPLNFLRSILQHRQQWILLFSGSHLRDELPDYWSDYLINSISIQLDYLLESEARELIQRPVEDFPLSIYEPAAVDAIIELTRCQPYLVQLMCYQLVELLNHYIRSEQRLAKTTTATVADVEKSIPKVLERGDQYFRELWNSLEDKERKLLLRLVQNQALTSQDNKLVRRLIKKEILQCVENCGNNMCYKYATFQVPLVQKYIEQEIDA